MIKFTLSLYLLVLFFTLTSSCPHKYNGHVRSTFDLNFNTQSYQSDYDFGLKLIQTSEDKPPKWMSEREISQLRIKKIKFMDVTDNMELGTQYKPSFKREYPIQPSFPSLVKPFIGNLTTAFMKQNLKKLTSFENRYYRSKSGAKASNWLYKHILCIIKAASDKNLDVSISVRKFSHKWKQNSIIARFEGSDPDKQNEVVIISAHLDSINMWHPILQRAPGADDDGSGTVTILEAFRVLVAGQFKPQRPVEFHWYAAEEGGLLGSQAVASLYERERREVIAMLQNDMTGFIGKNGESFGIVGDFVDKDLTAFVMKLVDSYSGIPYRPTKCGYACSDHASWKKAGYPSACATEAEFSDTNPHIHTSNDVIKHISYDHMIEFSKLCVSFAIELSYS